MDKFSNLRLVGLCICLALLQGLVGSLELTREPSTALRIGQSVTLTCRLANLTNLFKPVVWEQRLNGKVEQIGIWAENQAGFERYQLTVDDETLPGGVILTLTIPAVQVEDAAAYACVFTAENKEQSLDLSQDIIAPPTSVKINIGGVAYEDGVTQPLPDEDGAEYDVTCTIDGSLPAPNGMVLHNGQMVQGFQQDVQHIIVPPADGAPETMVTQSYMMTLSGRLHLAPNAARRQIIVCEATDKTGDNQIKSTVTFTTKEPPFTTTPTPPTEFITKCPSAVNATEYEEDYTIHVDFTTSERVVPTADEVSITYPTGESRVYFHENHLMDLCTGDQNTNVITYEQTDKNNVVTYGKAFNVTKTVKSGKADGAYKLSLKRVEHNQYRITLEVAKLYPQMFRPYTFNIDTHDGRQEHKFTCRVYLCPKSPKKFFEAISGSTKFGVTFSAVVMLLSVFYIL